MRRDYRISRSPSNARSWAACASMRRQRSAPATASSTPPHHAAPPMRRHRRRGTGRAVDARCLHRDRQAARRVVAAGLELDPARRTESGDGWTAPVIAARRQEGCIRFSYLPLTARVPRRYQCLPESAARPERRRCASRRCAMDCGLRPTRPQLRRAAPDRRRRRRRARRIPHFLKPQRETNLRVRLKEYLRAGLEAGIFYES